MKRIAKLSAERWEKGKVKIDEKVVWSVKKFLVVKDSDGEENADDWSARIANGSGPDR